MLLSIIVISYNQERLVLETLESIKNQAISYGRGKQIQIIICDDCSTDSTYWIEKRWSGDNKNLFYDIVILPSDINRGTNGNYLRAIDYIQGDYFFDLAGDDLLADEDIIVSLGEKDIYIYPYLSFQNELYGDSLCMPDNQFNYWNLDFKEIKKISKFFNPFNSQSWVWKKGLITNQIYEKIKMYNTFEDVPRWYYLMYFSDSLQITFCDIPLTLYRLSENSVSHLDSGDRYLRHLRDQVYFYKQRIDDTKTMIDKYIAFMYYKSFENKNNLWFKILNPHQYYMWARLKIIKSKRKQIRIVLENNCLDRNINYLNKIKKEADKYFQFLV